MNRSPEMQWRQTQEVRSIKKYLGEVYGDRPKPEPKIERIAFIYRADDGLSPFAMALGEEIEGSLSLLDVWIGRDFETALEKWLPIRHCWLHQTNPKTENVSGHYLYKISRELGLWPTLAEQSDPGVAWAQLLRKHRKGELAIASQKIEALIRPSADLTVERIALSLLAANGVPSWKRWLDAISSDEYHDILQK